MTNPTSPDNTDAMRYGWRETALITTALHNASIEYTEDKRLYALGDLANAFMHLLIDTFPHPEFLSKSQKVENTLEAANLFLHAVAKMAVDHPLPSANWRKSCEDAANE